MTATADTSVRTMTYTSAFLHFTHPFPRVSSPAWFPLKSSLVDSSENQLGHHPWMIAICFWKQPALTCEGNSVQADSPCVPEFKRPSESGVDRVD